MHTYNSHLIFRKLYIILYLQWQYEGYKTHSLSTAQLWKCGYEIRAHWSYMLCSQIISCNTCSKSLQIQNFTWIENNASIIRILWPQEAVCQQIPVRQLLLLSLSNIIYTVSISVACLLLFEVLLLCVFCCLPEQKDSFAFWSGFTMDPGLEQHWQRAHIDQQVLHRSL